MRPGGWITALDNPPLLGEYLLDNQWVSVGTSPQAFSYVHFGLIGWLACDGNCSGDGFIKTGPTSEILAVPNPFLDRVPGELFRFEVHGTRLGPSSAEAVLKREYSGGVTTPGGNAERRVEEMVRIPLRLDPETLIVPVNVVVVRPGTGMAGERQFMERFADSDVYEMLFDGRNDTTEVRAPSGGAGYDVLVNSMLDMTEVTDGIPPDLGASLIRSAPVGSDARPLGYMPDDIFAQCGIQFRLAQYVTITEDDPQYVQRFDATGAGICGGYGTFGALGQLRTRFKAEAATLLANPMLPTVFVTHRINAPPSTVGGPCSELDYGVELEGDVILGMDHVVSHAGSGHRWHYVLAHELGHVLNLEHPPLGCGDGGPGHQLMCASPRNINARIAGCQRREGVELAELPHNCLPFPDDANVGPDLCDVARDAAANLRTDPAQPIILTTPILPSPVECTSSAGAEITKSITASHDSGIASMTLSVVGGSELASAAGSPLDASFTAPLGETRYRVEATSNDGGTTSKERLVSVVDTTAPSLVVDGEFSSVECSPTNGISVPFPAATDVCSGVTVTGRVVATNGEPLTNPIDVGDGTGVLVGTGVHEIEWTAVDEAGNSSTALQSAQVLPCMAAGSSLELADGIIARDGDGLPLDLVNFGDGPVQMGVESESGSITTRGDLVLRNRAKVHGAATAAGTISMQDGAEVAGAINASAIVALPAAPTLATDWPGSSEGGVALEPNESLDLAAGSYGHVSVKSHATLRVTDENGTYFFEGLELEPDGAIETPAGARIEVRDVLRVRGSFVSADGGAAPVALVYHGNQPVYVERSFAGSVMAPHATLVLGGTTGQEFVGQFFADRLEVRAGVLLEGQDWPTAGLIPGAQLQSMTMREEGELLATHVEPIADGGCSWTRSPVPGAGPWLYGLSALGLGAWMRRRRVTRGA